MSEPSFGQTQGSTLPQEPPVQQDSIPSQSPAATDVSAPSFNDFGPQEAAPSFNAFGDQEAAPALNPTPPQAPVPPQVPVPPMDWGTPLAAQGTPNPFPAGQPRPNQGPPQTPGQPYPGGAPGQNPGSPPKKGGGAGFKVAEILLGVGCIGAILLALCGAGIWYFVSKATPNTNGSSATTTSNSSTSGASDSNSTSATTTSSATNSGSAVTPPPEIENRQSLMNLKQLALAMLQYPQDNHDKFPPMESAQSIEQALGHYIKVESVFLVPNSQRPYQPNTFLSGKTVSSISNPSAVVAFYEPDAGPDGGRCVAFVDGHAKWLQPSEWDAVTQSSTFSSPGSAATSSSSTPATGEGSSSSVSGGDSSAQEALQALVKTSVSKFTLVKSSVDAAIIKNGGAKAAVSASYSAPGTHIEHLLIQWSSYDSGDSFTNKVVDKFLGDGYQMMDKRPLNLNGREIGKQMLLRKGDLEIILWTHQDKCFVAIGPPGDTLDFYKHTPY